jgi:hypothetical protein
MSRFFPGRKLSFSEIALIPEALFLLFVFRLKVSYQPSRNWMPKAASDSAGKIAPDKMVNAQLVVKVIKGLESRTPWNNTCLVKALTAHKMLQRRLVNHKIHIGVELKSKNSLGAHAWLSVGDDIVLGGENLGEFHEISSFK